VSYTGKIGNRTISASQAVIVLFGDGQVLEFATLKEANGFVKFYAQNRAATARNPAKTYVFEGGSWILKGSTEAGP